jgi:hypothetical protein
MKESCKLMLLCCVLLSGCISPQRNQPSSPEETIRRMKQVRIAEVRIPQEEVMTTLRDFEALGKYAELPFRLSARPVIERADESKKEWLTLRQQLQKPVRHGRGITQWNPAGPEYTIPVVTFSARDTTLHEALTLICQISGLRWSVNRGNGVVVSFETREGQQPAAQLQSEGAPSD